MYNHRHVIWGCIQPSRVTPESLALVLPWDLNAVQLQEIMKWCKHDKHGMERYITYKSIISGKLCFMDMEPIWKAGGFYIYSIADTIALSAGSRPKSVEFIRIFSSNKNPLQLLTPENFHETPGNTISIFTSGLYFRSTRWHMSWKKSWCTKLENCAFSTLNCLKAYLCASGMIYRFPEI